MCLIIRYGLKVSVAPVQPSPNTTMPTLNLDSDDAYSTKEPIQPQPAIPHEPLPLHSLLGLSSDEDYAEELKLLDKYERDQKRAKQPYSTQKKIGLVGSGGQSRLVQCMQRGENELLSRTLDSSRDSANESECSAVDSPRLPFNPPPVTFSKNPLTVLTASEGKIEKLNNE